MLVLWILIKKNLEPKVLLFWKFSQKFETKGFFSLKICKKLKLDVVFKKSNNPPNTKP
jgi:hypothetical protein